MSANRQWMGALMGDCQMLAGRCSDTSAAVLFTEIDHLVTNLPPSRSRIEQLIVGAVLGQFLAHIVRQGGIEGRADVGRGFLNLAGVGTTLEGWRTQWVRVVECCVAGLPDGTDKRPLEAIDARVNGMRRLVEARYADPLINARELAKTVSLSPGYAARMLKRQTGFGFVAHLHRCRIAAARDLLVETALSIKEIAAAVGYAHPCQLSRQFKLACGVTPLAFRATRVSRPSA